MFASYSTFPGGATAYSLNTSGFDALDINGGPAVELITDPSTGETQAVIRVDFEIPPDENSYCFDVEFDQHSKYGTLCGRVGCNGKKCVFEMSPVYIAEGCANPHTLPCVAWSTDS